MKLPALLRALAPALALCLSACLEPLNLAGGGIGGTGISVEGIVTGFGSVFVSGIEYQTSSTTVYKVDSNGQATQGDLKIGMVVRLSGTFASDGTPQATNIVYQPSVKGPVTCNTDGTLTVLQQTVKTDSNPTYDGFNCQGGNGKVVEVSGLRDAAGVIHATRIGLAAGTSQVYEAHGQVANLVNTAGGQQTFSLGSLTVNFANATPPAGLANGARVEVNGTLASGGTVLNATSISMDDDQPAPQNSKANIEGLITALLSSTTFQVGNQVVSTTGSTTITDTNGTPLTTTQLQLGWRVSVSGTIDASGNLVAVRVRHGGD
jgi:Domain of unknown function (DUF5666)